MDEGELIEAVAADLFTYVLGGDFPDKDLGGVLKPTELPPQYNNFEDLVDLHFILREDVQRFADLLEDRLRGIKTETRAEENVQRGGLDGHIDWEGTYQHRATSSPRNRSLYVVRSQEEEYAIPENIVLKEVVNTIHKALDRASLYLDPDHSWAAGTWVSDDRQLREEFISLAKRNYTLQRIPDPSAREPTDRMLSRAESARQPVYREAAELLSKRRKYSQSSSELASLIEDTIIAPEDREDLFELYVLFRILDSLREVESHRIGTPTYYAIASGREAVASFDGDAGLRVYYDQTPDDEIDITFKPYLGSAESRSEIAHKTSQRVTDAFLTETNVQEHTKRPDVLVASENRIAGAPESNYLVVEVKDSTDEKRIREGIEEIVEYLSFLYREDSYEFPKGEFGEGINGLLVVQDLDDVDFEPASTAGQASENLPVRIIQASDLPVVLPSIVRRVFDPAYSS